MKAILSILIIAGLAIAQSSGPQDATAPTSAAQPTAGTQSKDPNAQKAEMLVQQMIQALGGDAYLNIRDVEQEGRTSGFYHGNPSGATSPFWRFYRFPDKERVELTKQRDWILIYTGNEGFESTFRGTRPLPAKDLNEYLLRREYSLDAVLRQWVKALGTAFFYEGSAFADNKQVDNVTIITASNQVVTISIDTTTHLPLKKTFRSRDPESRELDEESEVYGNYRPEQGLNTAHVITRLKNGEMTSERFLSKVTYNQNFPDSMFVPGPPVKKK
jgi:hypothetical protein